jgi:hypothetical protein
MPTRRLKNRRLTSRHGGGRLIAAVAMLVLAGTLEAQTTEPPESNVTEEGTWVGATAEELRQKLLWLEAQEQELAAKMHDGHPQLVAVREQIRGLKETLARQPETKAAPLAKATPVQPQNAPQPRPEQAQRVDTAKAEALAARERSLAAAEEQLRSKMAELKGQSTQIEQLTKRVAQAEQSHKEYVEQLQQARTNPTPISVPLEAASVAATEARTLMPWPNGLAIAGLCSMLLVLVASRRKKSIVTAKQLARAIDVPVVGVIPRGTFGAA